jgi:hypothetical protein
MNDYERIAWFLICPDCWEPRISLKAALCLAASARTVPAWRHFVDVQESLYAEIEGMNAMGPHQ